MGDKSNDLLKQFEKERRQREDIERARELKKRQIDAKFKDDETRLRAKKLDDRNKTEQNEEKVTQEENERKRKEITAETNRAREEFWKKMKSKLERKDDLIDTKIKDLMQSIKSASGTKLQEIDSRTEIQVDYSRRKLKQVQRDLDDNCRDIIRRLKVNVDERESVIKRTLEDRRLPDHFLDAFVSKSKESGSKDATSITSIAEVKKNKNTKEKKKEISADSVAESSKPTPPTQPTTPYAYPPYFMPPFNGQPHPGQPPYFYPPPPGYGPPSPNGQPPYYNPMYQMPPGYPQSPKINDDINSPKKVATITQPNTKPATPVKGQKSPVIKPGKPLKKEGANSQKKANVQADKWQQYLETPKQAQARLANEAIEKGRKPKFVPLPTPGQSPQNDYQSSTDPPKKHKKNHKHKHKKDKKRDKKAKDE